MAVVPAKCMQCGGILSVDEREDASICKHCGTPFIVRKAIANYYGFCEDTNSNSMPTDYWVGISNARMFLELGEYEQATHHFRRIADYYPEKCAGWWGLLACSTKNFTRETKSISFITKEEDELANKALGTIKNPEKKNKAEMLYKAYRDMTTCKDRLSQLSMSLIHISAEHKSAVIIAIAIGCICCLGALVSILCRRTGWKIVGVALVLIAIVSACVFRASVLEIFRNIKKDKEEVQAIKTAETVARAELVIAKENLAKLSMSCDFFDC